MQARAHQLAACLLQGWQASARVEPQEVIHDVKACQRCKALVAHSRAWSTQRTQRRRARCSGVHHLLRQGHAGSIVEPARRCGNHVKRGTLPCEQRRAQQNAQNPRSPALQLHLARCGGLVRDQEPLVAVHIAVVEAGVQHARGCWSCCCCKLSRTSGACVGPPVQLQLPPQCCCCCSVRAATQCGTVWPPQQCRGHLQQVASWRNAPVAVIAHGCSCMPGCLLVMNVVSLLSAAASIATQRAHTRPPGEGQALRTVAQELT